jgi:hypothetical protein
MPYNDHPTKALPIMRFPCALAICAAMLAGCRDKAGEEPTADESSQVDPAADDAAEDETLTAGAAAVGEIDAGPTILGFTPELQAEMQAAIAAHDPSADAGRLAADYMNRVRQTAERSDIRPNADGDYLYPAEQQKQFDAWSDPKAAMEIYNEFEPRLPS